uniref:Zinc finger, matrin-type 5 n=1 Tax=Salmo trutta TaxID=8032 RepID=A0A673WPN9_SALTR
MVKRYYCDYCDRPFQDNMHNRRKHIGKKNTAAILYDERTKKPCRRFLNTGQCVFGNNCRFSHMSEGHGDQNLRMQIEDERRSREDTEHRASPEWSIEEFLTMREKRRATLSSGRYKEDDDNQPANDIPPHFLTIPDLPPSLLPPPPSGWKVWLN